MRAVLLALSVLAVAASSLCAAGAPGPFHPVPFGPLQWSNDTPNPPTTAGLIGRWQVILVVDIEEGEGKTGKGTSDSFGWNYVKNQATDQRFIPFLITVNGQPGGRGESDPNSILKAGGPVGMVRAFAGDASGVLIVVAPDGRIQRLQRHSGDIGGIRGEMEKQITSATPLVIAPASFPLSCKPALELLRLGNVPGALALARKKLGPDGAQLSKGLQDQANVLIEAETTRFASPAGTPSERFIARERLKGMLEEFPTVPAAAAAVTALKAKPDKELQNETMAWAMLQDYLLQMAKTPAKKSAMLQQQAIPAIIAKFPGTYGAEVATMIKVAAKLP